MDTVERKGPLLSYIVPVWNRAGCVQRCLDSIFSQDFNDYEVIAVDDGSDDDSLTILRQYRQERLQVVSLGQNQGVSVARNAGAERAKGAWLAYLDSDDALLPGGASIFADVARTASNDAGILGFGYRTDHGTLSPKPFPPVGLVAFPVYLRWARTAASTDYFHLHRRECWQRIPWPKNRATEAGTTLRLMANFPFYFYDKIVGIVHTDATNRYSRKGQGTTPSSIPYDDSRADIALAMNELGAVLRREDPDTYYLLLRQLAIMDFGCSRRLKGFRHSLACLAGSPLNYKTWAVLVLGLLGPDVLRRFRH